MANDKNPYEQIASGNMSSRSVNEAAPMVRGNEWTQHQTEAEIPHKTPTPVHPAPYTVRYRGIPSGK